MTEFWSRLPRESPFLQGFRILLDAILGSLLQVTLLQQGVGLEACQSSPPTSTMLEFCDWASTVGNMAVLMEMVCYMLLFIRAAYVQQSASLLQRRNGRWTAIASEMQRDKETGSKQPAPAGDRCADPPCQAAGAAAFPVMLSLQPDFLCLLSHLLSHTSVLSPELFIMQVASKGHIPQICKTISTLFPQISLSNLAWGLQNSCWRCMYTHVCAEGTGSLGMRCVVFILGVLSVAALCIYIFYLGFVVMLCAQGYNVPLQCQSWSFSRH